MKNTIQIKIRYSSHEQDLTFILSYPEYFYKSLAIFFPLGAISQQKIALSRFISRNTCEEGKVRFSS